MIKSKPLVIVKTYWHVNDELVEGMDKAWERALSLSTPVTVRVHAREIVPMNE